MKEPTIYWFTDFLGVMREVFLVRGEYRFGGLRIMFVERRGDHWEEWLPLTTFINELDGRHAYIESSLNKDKICAFLEQNGLAKPTGESVTEEGILCIWEYPMYEFTDKFFDEALIFAEED